MLQGIAVVAEAWGYKDLHTFLSRSIFLLYLEGKLNC